MSVAMGEDRTKIVRRTRGFAALWDFGLRDASGRFDAWKAKGESADLRLDFVNYVRDYWKEGRAAAADDFRVVDDGPFGHAVELPVVSAPDFRPLFLIPRERLSGSRIDVHGAGRSVTLVAWVKRLPESGAHAIAGIWHEGTDLANHGTAAARVERGQRQYALFAGLAANPYGVAGHVSDNGASSFGDRYARHLAVTKEKMPEGEWSAAAMVFDNERDTVTTYLDGVATEHWIEEPAKHPFFQHAARAWERGEYRPPAAFVRVENGQLKALRANPYWYPHDLWSPPAGVGGPFTIGRVIHMGRQPTSPGRIGGVAVFDRALSAKEVKRLVFKTRRATD